MKSFQGNTNAAFDQKASVPEGNAKWLAKLEKQEAILRRNPNDAYAHRAKGNALNGLRRYSEALISLNAALKIDPNNAYAHRNKGNALTGLGRYIEALVSCDAALKINSNNAYAHSNKGAALSALGRYSEALVSCDAALKINSNNAYAHSNKGAALSALGRYSEALVSYDAALKINPNNAYAHRNKGNALYGLLRYSEALVSYDAALRIDPNDAVTHSNKGNVLNDLGRYSEALVSRDAALRINPNDADAHYDKANALNCLGRYSEALVSYYDAALRIDPNNAYAHSYKGNALNGLGRYSEALVSFDAALKIDPNNADAKEKKQLALDALAKQKPETVNTNKNANAEAKSIPSVPPEKVWHFDASIKPAANTVTEYVLIPAAERDMKKVNEYYQRGAVAGYEIRSIKVIYNPALNRSFSLALKLLQKRDGNKAFEGKWKNENNSDWRSEIQKELIQSIVAYQDSDYPAVKLAPVWHGTKPDILESLFSGGYAALATTDGGFFGKGLYSAFEAEYSYRFYSKGALILNWVAFYSAYPVIHGDMGKLIGKGNYGNYDAHYIPVVSERPQDLDWASYIPCKPKQKFTYRELVVFETSHCMPRYLVELQPSLPKAVSSATHEQKSQSKNPNNSSAANLGMFGSSAAIASSSSFNPNSANANIANASGYGVNAAPTALGKKG